MNRVVEILMKRDGLTQNEAELAVEDAYAELMDCTNILDAETIMMQELGLEMDYFEDVIGG